METIASESTTAAHNRLELLTAKELEDRLTLFSSEERVAVANFLTYLGEVDRRATYLQSGSDTLWSFVHDKLGFPECQTYLRTSAAKVVSAYPDVTTFIVDGRLNLSALAMLRNVVFPHGQGRLSSQAASTIFDAASNLSTRKLKRYLASLRAPIERAPDGFRDAKPPIATVVEASVLALRPDADQLVSAVVDADGKTTYVSIHPGKAVLLTGIDPVNRIVPIAKNQKEFVATIVGDDFENDLAELAFLSPGLDPTDYLGLVQKAVKSQIRRLKKKKGLDPNEPILAKQAEARAAAGANAPVSEDANRKAELEDPSVARAVLAEISERLGRVNIPVRVQAEVLRRASFCCEMIDENGIRCCSTRRCQFDHRKPVSKGGTTDSENLRVLCERHNLLEARRILGDRWVDECIARNRKKRSAGNGGLRAHEVN